MTPTTPTPEALALLADELGTYTVAELRRMARSQGLTALARTGRRVDLITALSSPEA